MEPQRTCVGCRAKASKGELVRVVREPSGVIRVDATGKAEGRGAYLHPRAECASRAMRGQALGHALRTPLGAAEAASLMRELTEVAGTGKVGPRP